MDTNPGAAAPTGSHPGPASHLDLPTGFTDELVEGLGVGSPSKVGILQLTLALAGGTTRVRRRYSSGPLCLMHPVYIDPGRPDMAFLYTFQLGDGLVEGDRYRITLDCGPGTATHVTTQAATKIYRMDHNYAAQHVTITAGEDSAVEYLPDPIIPFRGSRFYQSVQVTAAASATVILGEVILPGRVARGERHAYDLLHLDTHVARPDGRLLFADRTRLQPSRRPPTSAGLLGTGGVLGTLYIVTTHLGPGDLSDLLWPDLDADAQVVAGVSQLPNNTGVAVRLLGHNSIDVRAAFHRTWDQARRAVLGVRSPSLRKDG